MNKVVCECCGIEHIKVTCQACGKVFNAPTIGPVRAYCSSTCRSRKAPLQEGNEIEAKCIGCGKRFKYTSLGGPPRKYCTLQCQKDTADKRRNPDKYIQPVRKKRKYAT